MKDEQSHTQCPTFCVYIIRAIASDLILSITINTFHYNNQQGTTYMIMETKEYVQKTTPVHFI